MHALIWLVRAAIFFTLFAFALNNQHEATLKWFFGYESRAPMVFIVLMVFGAGAAFGALAMLPSWWRHRRAARAQAEPGAAPVKPAPLAEEEQPLGADAAAVVPPHPPRDGL